MPSLSYNTYTHVDSAVTSLIKEAFVELPPGSTLPPVTLSASSNETLGSNLSSNLTLILVDTSCEHHLPGPEHGEVLADQEFGRAARREDRPRLEHELRKANVVLIVYAVDDPQSVRAPCLLLLPLLSCLPFTGFTQFERISMYWMSSLRSLGISLPVVLVGNKTDLRSQGPQDTQSLEEGALPSQHLSLASVVNGYDGLHRDFSSDADMERSRDLRRVFSQE